MTTTRALTMTHSVPDDSELVLLGARGDGSRVFHDDDPGPLLRLALGLRGGRGCRRLRLRLLRRSCVELEEVVDLGVEESLLAAGAAAGAAGSAGLVRQGERHILGGLVAEQMVALEVANRLHYRFQILARGVSQVESRLRRPVVQRVRWRWQPKIRRD